MYSVDGLLRGYKGVALEFYVDLLVVEWGFQRCFHKPVETDKFLSAD